MTQLATWLDANRELWVARPFVEQPVAWEAEHAAVARWLRGLDDEAIDRLEAEPGAAPDAPAAYRAWAEAARQASALPALAWRTAATLEPRLRRGVPGRKWRQLEAFAPLIAAALPGEARHLVDWCAGKGHLGRTLSALTARAATLVERDAQVCASGRALSARLGAPCAHAVLDVFADRETAAGLLDATRAGVGLHACGALGDRLLEAGAERAAPLLALAPCCYHVLAPGQTAWAARSAHGRALGLCLTPAQLRLAIYDEVVAPGRARRARRREMAWRTGFDLLHREASGVDRYTALGPLPSGLVALSFGRFCEAAAAHTGLALPARFDAARAERAGRERARAARALGMVRALFRRPLEVWLVLDRAQRQLEAGRVVHLGTFCPRTVTPRNLAIVSLAG